MSEQSNEITNEYKSNEQIITITPEKIRTSLDTNKSTQISFDHKPYNYSRAELFVTMATQSSCCNGQSECCGCYKQNSLDSRCCGLCYAYCPRQTLDEQSDCCPNNFSTYWDSGYVQTTSGYQTEHGEHNGICCWFCFPLKFALFFPCCFGSLCNGFINHIRNTNMNYFF